MVSCWSINCIFKNRLRNHPTFNSENFIDVYSIFLFEDSQDIDAYTLENDFFLKAPEILGKKKAEIQKCSSVSDFSFQVQDQRQIQFMLNACMTNPKVCYKNTVRQITNLELLKGVSEKGWFRNR